MSICEGMGEDKVMPFKNWRRNTSDLEMEEEEEATKMWVLHCPNCGGTEFELSIGDNKSRNVWILCLECSTDIPHIDRLVASFGNIER
jgi:hypothetical protein